MSNRTNDQIYNNPTDNAIAKASAESRPSALLMSMRRIRHLVRKEFIQIVRHRQNFGMLLLAPILQLVVFGYASRLDVKDITMVVADLDRSAMSRQVADAFSRSGYFKIVDHVNSYDAVDDFMLRGKASMALLIPPDFERQIQGYRTANVGVLIDGVDTTTAGTASGYAQSILQGFSMDVLNERVRQMQGQLYESSNPRIIKPTITDAGRALFNPNLNSKDFFVPGVVVLILVAMGIVLTSAVIVREKEIGTIEQLMVAPISRLELILGKTIPCFIIEVTTLTVIAPLAFLIFDVPFQGSVGFFYFTAIIFLITTSGVGMTISAFCKTQQQAMLTSFMFLQPSILLSGYAFPIENMPVVIQYVTYLNPLRYFITIVRGVFLKGTGWETLWPQIIPLLVMAVFYVGMASLLLKKRVD